MDLEPWAESIVQEVYETWKTKFSFWRQGVKIFYSPVRKSPDVMIVGHNPGGDESSFAEDLKKFERGDFSLPDANEYLVRNYLIARRMRDFFHDRSVLENSVTFNLIFFRSKDVRLWNSLPLDKRTEMEAYCRAKFRQIVERLKPRIILAEGMKTFDDIARTLAPIRMRSVVRTPRGVRLVCVGSAGDVVLFGMPHPSGSRINGKDWNRIRGSFYKLYEEIL